MKTAGYSTAPILMLNGTSTYSQVQVALNSHAPAPHSSRPVSAIGRSHAWSSLNVSSQLRSLPRSILPFAVLSGNPVTMS